jgi:hypothetical protein
MKRCFSSPLVLLVGLLVLASTVSAQKTETPALDGILQRLQENLDQYKALVPSFFCDEHVVSKKSPDPQHGDRVTDSTFRLKWVAIAEPDSDAILQESREIKMVNGRPANGTVLSGPTSLRGAFSGGLALVSLSQQACMRYTLKPIKPNHPKDPIVVQFVGVPASLRPYDCLMQEEISGRVSIDPATMQIKRMEFHAPHHLIVPEGYTWDVHPILQVVGTWDLSIDYAPVLLGGKSFWLPTKISETMIGTVGGVWTYDATYRNYHKLEVTSRIVPASEEPVP